MRSAIAAALVVLPTMAFANPITIGVSGGASQAEADASSGLNANRTLGLFGRIGLGRQLSAQLEATKVMSDQPSVSIRNASALVVLDLASSASLVPILLAGVGLDNATGPFSLNVDAHHAEVGLGLELRTRGGFTLGADVRLGTRSLDSQTMAAVDTYYTPITLRDGGYRTARVSVGATF